jgi:hypothetical protein
MSCGDFAQYSEFFANGQFIDGIYCPFVDVLGPVAAPLMFFAPIGVGLYLASGSFLLPAIVAILVGSVVIVQAPGIAVNIVGIVLIIGIALAVFVMLLRLNRQV